jgi:Domain of unknown function (DUF1772)
MKNLLRFITIFFEVITLSALLTHLLELPGKINLSKENYQVVQGIYRGWSWLGIFEIGAIFLTLIWTLADSRKKRIFPFLLTALLCFIISITIFFIFTFPANNTTVNWTQLPGDWQSLQKNWEYSHAVRAVLNLVGFSFLIVTLLKEKNRYNR